MDERLASEAIEEERGAGEQRRAPLATATRAATELHAGLREQRAQRPYLILGAACGVGLAAGAQRTSLRRLLGVALGSGLKAVLGTLLEGRLPATADRHA